MVKADLAKKQIELTYSLAELPSSQHRAGLAGLVMVVEYLNSMKDTGVSLNVSKNGVTIKLDQDGLGAILDEIYAATEELQGRATAFKDVTPVKTEEETYEDAKGKAKKRKIYYYPIVVPKGSFLHEFDTSENGTWIKLWRDMVWQILRGVPATRSPYEERARGEEPSDTTVIWKQLQQDKHRSVDLPSTYFLGAQAFNAERVPFKDNSHFQFLLHFWPFICQIYVPQVVDRENKKTQDGYVVAFPDIANLRDFIFEFKKAMTDRKNEVLGFRPKECLIEIPEEAGVDFLLRIAKSIGSDKLQRDADDAIFGVDIYHMKKEGNNIRILFSGRIEPDAERDRRYDELKGKLFDNHFRRQRLVNLLVRNCDWYTGFDKLMAVLPPKEVIFTRYFAHDALTSLTAADEDNKRRLKRMQKQADPSTGEQASVEGLILKITDSYLRQKLQSKYGLEWKNVEGNPHKKKEYIEKKEAATMDCFYAIRSRTGEDFINYFASTICSVPHWMSQEEYSCLTKLLYDNTEKVRTLTMLALSARISKDKQEEGGND